MKTKSKATLAMCMFLGCLIAQAQSIYEPHSFTILAGSSGQAGRTDGLGSLARFSLPWGIALDTTGNIYVTDQDNNVIRKITPSGLVSTLAGGTFGSADGTGSAAEFSNLGEIALDSLGNAYVADASNHTIRKCTPAGVVTTFAGLAGAEGSADGTGNAARFSFPLGMAVDSSDNVYVGEYGNNTIRKITPSGVVTTLAGMAGSPGSADGTGAAARFLSPHGLAVDSGGNIYVADSQNGATGNNTIRKVTPDGVVTTVAGLAGAFGNVDGSTDVARFYVPYDVAVDSTGNLYVADEGNSSIRKITPGGVVTTLTGQVGIPLGIAVDNSGKLYITDANNAVRVSLHTVPPTAVAGLDQNIRAGDTVFLDGSASFDDNTASTALLYSWNFSSRPAGSTATLAAANTATPSFVADVTGTFDIELVVTDEAGLSSAPDYVICSSANLAPTAVATVDFNLVILGEIAHLDGSASTDPEFDPLSYSWSIAAKPSGSTAALVNAGTATPTLMPDKAGVYQVTLVVSDFLGPSTPATVEFTATTVAGFAVSKIVIASSLISSLSSSQVTTKGNQTALLNFLSQAVVALQKWQVATAIDKLTKSIERTDGCVLRGSPDGNGAGMDWITACPAQTQAYSLLKAAQSALAP